MARQEFMIKGGFDSTDIEKGVRRVDSLLTETFENAEGASLFSERSIELLEKGIKAHLDQAVQYMSRLTESAKKLDDALQDSNNTEERKNELLTDRLKIEEKIGKTRKQIRSFQEAKAVATTGPKQRGVMDAEYTDKTKKATSLAIAPLGQAASNLPGSRGMSMLTNAAKTTSASVKNLGGIATLAGAAVSILAAAAVGGAYAISRAHAGFEKFSAILPQLITKAGVGAPDINYGKIAGTLGYQEGEVAQVQTAATRAFGATENREEEQVRTEKLLGFSRATGIEPQQLTGAGEQIRATSGSEQANKDMAKMMELSFTKGIQKSEIPYYLSSSTALLTDINKTGMMNSSTMLSTLASLVATTDMAPERAAKVLSGLQGSIAGSTGESNAFFQMAYGRQGLGGGSLLGAQAAVQQGLVGLDKNKFLGQLGGSKTAKQAIGVFDEMGITGPDFGQKGAKGITDMLDARYGKGLQKGGQGAMKLSAMQNLFQGGRTLPEMAQFLDILEKQGAGQKLSPKEQKTLEDIDMSKTEIWQRDSLSVMNTIAGNTQLTKANANAAAIALGKSTASKFNTLTDMQTKTDSTLLEVIKLMGLGEGEKGAKINERQEKFFDPSTGGWLSGVSSFMNDVTGGILGSSTEENQRANEKQKREFMGPGGSRFRRDSAKIPVEIPRTEIKRDHVKPKGDDTAALNNQTAINPTDMSTTEKYLQSLVATNEILTKQTQELINKIGKNVPGAVNRTANNVSGRIS